MRPTLRVAPKVALAGLVALALWAGPATAQDQRQDRSVDAGVRPAETTSQRRVRPRIVVTPSRRLVRQCVDGYAVERRATGDTVVPYMHCEWGYR